MKEKRVIVTVDRRQVTGMDELTAQLQSRGLQIDQVDTVLDVTQIVGRYQGDPKELNIMGGVCAEDEGWVDELND